MSARLFTPLVLRDTTFSNRIFVSPMCQYSSDDGVPHEWHLVHLGQFAVGGAGLVMTEATAVAPEGRLSPGDTGLWNDHQAAAWRPIVEFIHAQGALAGVQLAHGGRKGSTTPPWEGLTAVLPGAGGWENIGPSPMGFGDLPAPREMTHNDITRVIDDFAAATERAVAVGFDVVELHAAHGYLVHQFLSPISNMRTDAYGGDFEGRTRFLSEVAEAMRAVWPDDRPFFVRMSATDWVEGGWSLDETVEMSRRLASRGVDLIDCSSGGASPDAQISVGPGYQVPFAREIRAKAGVATGAVGCITEPAQAEAIIAEGSADAVLLGREILRQPHWPLLAAAQLGVPMAWPNQYAPAKPRDAP